MELEPPSLKPPLPPRNHCNLHCKFNSILKSSTEGFWGKERTARICNQKSLLASPLAAALLLLLMGLPSGQHNCGARSCSSHQQRCCHKAPAGSRSEGTRKLLTCKCAHCLARAHQSAEPSDQLGSPSKRLCKSSGCSQACCC